MAGESQLIFKLHPNEVAARATEEIERYAPGSLVYLDGVAEEMIANSRMMIAQFSSTVLGLRLSAKRFAVDFLMRSFGS